MHSAHRLAWFYVHGRWPNPGIDHINGQKGDNRICNLREANSSQNAQNQTLRKDNVCGHPGVQAMGGKWRARIRLNGISHELGYYEDIEDAAFAYSEAKLALHKFNPTVRGH
jgi:hypothetical protein